MNEDLPILLNFRVEEKKLILRLDNLGLQNFELGEDCICELVLEDFTNKEIVDIQLQEFIGEVFEYEINSENDKTFLEFWGDYGRIENTIQFKSVKIKNSAYTIEDLCIKGKILANLYSKISDDYMHNYHKFHTLTDKLKIELKDEIVRFQRKAEFFEEKERGKSEAFFSQIKILQKLLNFLEKRQ